MTCPANSSAPDSNNNGKFQCSFNRPENKAELLVIDYMNVNIFEVHQTDSVSSYFSLNLNCADVYIFLLITFDRTWSI